MEAPAGLVRQALSSLSVSDLTMRYAIIKDGCIANLIMLDPGATWPVPEGCTLLPADEAEALYEWEPEPAPAVKVWPNAEYFMAEFSLQEKGAIALSNDPVIAGLRLMLSTWFSTVRADDEDVLLGLATLVATGIIDQTRRDQIAGL